MHIVHTYINTCGFLIEYKTPHHTMSPMGVFFPRSKGLIRGGNRSRLPHPPLKPLLKPFIVMFVNLLGLATL